MTNGRVACLGTIPLRYKTLGSHLRGNPTRHKTRSRRRTPGILPAPLQTKMPVLGLTNQIPRVYLQPTRKAPRHTPAWPPNARQAITVNPNVLLGRAGPTYSGSTSKLLRARN